MIILPYNMCDVSLKMSPIPLWFYFICAHSVSPLTCPSPASPSPPHWVNSISMPIWALKVDDDDDNDDDDDDDNDSDDDSDSESDGYSDGDDN